MNLADTKTGTFVRLTDTTKWDIVVFVTGVCVFIVNWELTIESSDDIKKKLNPYGFMGHEPVEIVIPKKNWIRRARKYLKYDYAQGGINNLDFVEALDKLKEYERNFSIKTPNK